MENNDKKPSYKKETNPFGDSIKDIFNFLPNPVFFVSPAKTILEVNPSFEEITGYKAEEITGKRIENIFNKEKTASLLETVAREGFIKMEEAVLVGKEKQTIPVSVSVMLRKDEKGEPAGFFFGLFDLTEIKKTEKDLRDTQLALTNMLEDIEDSRARAEEERNRTMAIINNLTDGLLLFDKEGKLSLINPAAEELFKIQAKDLINKSFSDLKSFPVLTPLIEALEKGEIIRKEVMLEERLILEVSSVPVLKEKMGNLVILHNITRDKMIERMKGEFVSLAAHQLRTPLSAIKWTMKMLIEGDLGKITKEQKEFIEKTYISNERMIKLINDLLNVTRIEEGRYLYKPILMDLEPITQFVVNLYKEEAEKRNIKLELKKTKERLPWVMLDSEKIKLAIQNLLENALRYSLSGGLVTVSLKYDKNEVELSVKDNGVGIPEDQQKRIFTKFFRADNVVKMDTEGSGLGLFITKNIIEAHNGRIWFKSKKGEGTTFYLALPAKEDSEDSPEQL